MWLCRDCHNRLHSTGKGDLAMKQLAQSAWEALDHVQTQDAKISRWNFIRRYGRSYL